jgi:hypothetical protein
MTGFYNRGFKPILKISISAYCRIYIISSVILLFTTSCTGDFQELLPGPKIQNTPYVPPTVRAGSAPISLLTPSVDPVVSATQSIELKPTPTPQCMPDLTYISDLTIPDGTIVTPGQIIDKRWQVENSGSCNWDKTYHLKLVAGSNLTVPLEQALYPARSGSQGTIRILFIAPDEIGTHRSAWQAHTPQGEPFGDPIFIEITIQ